MSHNWSRREFVRRMALGSLAVPILLDSLAGKLAAEEAVPRRPIIWLQGQTSRIHQEGIWSLPEFPEFLSKYFRVIPVNQLNLDALEVDLKIYFTGKSTPFFLILDGYFPDNTDSFLNNLLKDLIVVSRVAILLGNEAAYSSSRPEGFMDLESELLHMVETPFLKLPGTPAPTRHLLGVLNYLVLYGLPDLDEYKRPRMFHSTKICDRCEYRGDFESGRYVNYFGEKEGCLYLLGCKGPITKNSCPVEKWNGTSNWCVGVGSPCTGCSEPDYPDHDGLGVYGQLSSESAPINSFFVRNSGHIAQGTLAVTAAGIGLHAISKKTSTPFKIEKLDDFTEDEE